MSEPDWENFAKAVLTDWPTGDLDGAVLFDLSLQYGMIQEVPGGYKSDHHVDAEGICPEDGDPWYEYTFRGEAGPGLYSIAEMTGRITALLAELNAARAEAAVLLRERNELVAEVVSLRQALLGMVNTYPCIPPCDGWEAQALAHRDAKNALANTTTPNPITKTWNEAIEAAAKAADCSCGSGECASAELGIPFCYRDGAANILALKKGE